MNKAIARIPAIAFPLGIVGASLYYAPDFTWQLAYNLKLPITIFTLLCGIMALCVIDSAKEIMKNKNQVSSEYLDADWRMWTAINGMAVLGLLWLLVQAVPAPDFKKEVVTVTKPVEKIVYKPVYKAGKEIIYHTPKLEDALEYCLNHVANSADKETYEFCTKKATEAALPPYRTLTRTVYKIINNNYEKRFDQCFSKWDMKDVSDEQVLKYTSLCKDYAMGR